MTRKDMIYARSIFIRFAQREGMTQQQAAFEFDNFLTVNMVPVTEQFYTFVRRIGASIAVPRIKRGAMYRLFENSMNHATFSNTGV